EAAAPGTDWRATTLRVTWGRGQGGQTRSFGDVGSMSALPHFADSRRTSREVREWDGPAVLPPLTADRVSGGLRARGAHRHAPQDRRCSCPHYRYRYR